MGRSLLVALLAVLGLLCAAGMGYAAYFVSRGSVAVPVTRLQQQPAQQLTPARVRTKAKAKPERTVTGTTTRTVPTTTGDDHGGRGGSGNSGHGGGGGHGGDD